MRQDELRPARGSRHARRSGSDGGNSSGHGTYSGRGLKGQNARAGGGVKLGFEGGQLPLVRRMARKRGFTNVFKTEYEPLNVSRLAGFPAGSEVTAESLVEARIIKNAKRPLKILGEGALNVALTVRAHKFSAVARQKIEAAGGKVEEVAR